MGIKAPDVLKKLWGMGMTGVNINAAIDFDTAQILSSEFATRSRTSRSRKRPGVRAEAGRERAADAARAGVNP